MNRDQKASAIAQIAEDIRQSEAVFAVDYRGLSVPQAAELRARLRDADARFRVVKNTLTERAADEAGADQLKSLLSGPTALTFVRGDAAAAAKALSDVARTTQILEFKGGLMNGAALSAADVQSIARLPTRDVLYGQLVGVVASPLNGLARGLKALVSGLTIALGQIQEQGLIGGAAGPSEGATASSEDAGAEADPAAEASASEPEGGEEQPAEQEAAEQTNDDPDAQPHEAPLTGESPAEGDPAVPEPDQAEGDPTKTEE